MTNEPIYDDRIAAYVAARERIAAAEVMRGALTRTAMAGQSLDGPVELPPAYWALVTEAGILADLALAEPAVGYLAGNTLVHQGRRKHRNRVQSQLDRFVEHVEGKRGNPPLAEGDSVLVNAGQWAGRYGQVAATYLDNDPPAVDVELDPPGRPDDPNEPVVISVRPTEVTAVIR